MSSPHAPKLAGRETMSPARNDGTDLKPPGSRRLPRAPAATDRVHGKSKTAQVVQPNMSPTRIRFCAGR